MKVQHHCDCSCHGAATGAASAAGHGAAVPPSTGFFVLSLSLSLLICGLISTGIVSVNFW